MLKNKIFLLGIFIIVLFVFTNSQELNNETPERRDSTNQEKHNSDSVNQSHVNSENSNSNQHTEEDSFFSRVLTKSRESLKEISHYLNQFNVLLTINLIEFHTVLKDKLHIPYPADLLVFVLIGYFICSILMNMCCKTKNIYKNNPLEEMRKLREINKKYQDMASSFKKKQISDTKPFNTAAVGDSSDLNFQLDNINNKIESIKEELSGTLHSSQDFQSTIEKSHIKLYDMLQKYNDNSVRNTEENTNMTNPK